MAKNLKGKWRAVAYADCSGHISRMVLVRRDDGAWGVRTMWETGSAEVVKRGSEIDARQEILAHPACLSSQLLPAT